MNFDYSPDQRLLKDEARKFLAAECPIATVRAVLDDDGRTHDATLWSKVAEMGWLATVIPEAHGGLGLSHVELCAIAEEMGRALAPVPFASTLYAFAQGLQLAGSESQRAHWLPLVAQGAAIGCMATAEGPGEILPRELRVRAHGGRLTGSKCPVVDADVADVALVLAEADAGPTMFLVDLQGEGVARARLESLDPTRGLARLDFSGARAEQLGADGEGRILAERIHCRAAALLSFEQIGGAERCLEMARDFALERKAFGRSVASYQAIKHKLADVYVRTQLARSNAYYAAWALDNDSAELPIAAAAARIAACDAHWQAAKENVQTHGGMGFTWEVDAHLHYRRAQQLALAVGAPRYWKHRLVSQLELRKAH